jgi:hypothetical protein
MEFIFNEPVCMQYYCIKSNIKFLRLCSPPPLGGGGIIWGKTCEGTVKAKERGEIMSKCKKGKILIPM